LLDLPRQAAAGLVVAPVSDVLESFAQIEFPEQVDLVAGGPPCQGFSLAGRRDKDDARNELVWEFLEFVKLADPKFVIIENVVGMGRKFSSDDEQSTFSDVQTALASTGRGYVVNAVLVNAMHYGAPQYRPRLMVIGIRTEIAAVLGIERTNEIWNSSWKTDGADFPAFAPVPVTESEGTVLNDAIRDLQTLGEDASASRYVKAMQDGAEWGLTPRGVRPHNHEMRKHRPDTIYRFSFAQALANIGVSPRIMGPTSPSFLAREHARIDIWFAADDRELTIGASTFRDSLTFKRELARLSNSKHSQRVLKWTAPAHTVVTIPDDYIHPDEPRTFSVRELARIQGFPDDFVFEGKATTGGIDRRTSVPQYSQVGNAVSPLVGDALGRLVDGLLETYLSRSSAQDPNSLILQLLPRYSDDSELVSNSSD